MTSTFRQLLAPLADSAAMRIMGAGFAIYWIVLLPLSAIHAAGEVSVHLRGIVLAGAALLTALAMLQMGALVRAAGVLGAMQAPRRLWQHMKRSALVQLTLAWLLACALLAVPLAMQAAGVRPLSAAAILSVAASLATVRSLASGRLLPRWCTWLCDAPLLAIVATNVIGAGPGGMLASIDSLPATVLALAAIAWPLTAGVLDAWLERAAPPPSPSPAMQAARSRKQSLGARIAVYIRRHSIVSWNDTFHFSRTVLLFPMPTAIVPHKNAGASAAVPASTPIARAASAARLLWPSLPIAWFILPKLSTWWQAPLHADRIALVLLVVLTLSGSFVARDLHWRSPLVPGGLQRGRLAQRLWLTTLSVQYTVLAALALAYCLVARLGMQQSWTGIGSLFWGAALLPLELAFATSLALVLRALPRAGAWCAAYAALCLLGWIVRRFVVGGDDMIAVPLPMVLYAAALILVTALCIKLANRLWTTAVMLPRPRAARP